MIYELIGYDEITKTVNPQASLNILGSGGSVNLGSVSKTEHIGKENLSTIVRDFCSAHKEGLFVTIDEIQKVPIEDVSYICSAFQLASRKGLDIMLAVAGLPYVHPIIIQHEGCTYLRRSAHEELALFTWEEASDAFHHVFSEIKGLNVSSEIIDLFNKASYGHPYIMQLLGYHLILNINEHASGKQHNVTEKEAQTSIANAIFAYEQRALKPLVDELSKSEKAYLVHASKCLGPDRLANTAEIAGSLGTTINKASRQRAFLINHGIIAAPERGKIMFCIPYLADYLKKEERIPDAITIARQRMV